MSTEENEITDTVTSGLQTSEAWQNFVSGLSDDQKVVAEKYAPLFVKLSVERIIDIVKMAIDGDWQAAYKLTLDAMGKDEVVAAIKAQNEVLADLNEANASDIAQVKSFFESLFNIAVTFAVSAI